VVSCCRTSLIDLEPTWSGIDRSLSANTGQSPASASGEAERDMPAPEDL
jgi:hypothetical protein